MTASDAHRISSPSAGADLEEAIDAAIAACDGDLRATIRALIVANAYLEREFVEACASVSRDFVRGKAPTPKGGMGEAVRKCRADPIEAAQRLVFGPSNVRVCGEAITNEVEE